MVENAEKKFTTKKEPLAALYYFCIQIYYITAIIASVLFLIKIYLKFRLKQEPGYHEPRL